MKKIVIAILISLAVVAVASIAGITIYLSCGGAMPSEGAMKNAVEKNKKIVYNGQDLSVEAIFDKIEVEIVDGNEVTFDYYESEKVKRTIKDEDGKISFETEAPHFLNSVLNKYLFKIGIPKDFNGKLEIETRTGSVNVDLAGITCKQITVLATTGSVTVKNAVCNGDFKVEVTTGGTNVSNVKSENLSLQNTTGSISTNDVKVSKNVDLKTTTGHISVNNLCAAAVKIKLTTGSLKECKTDCKSFSAEATTGSLSFRIKSATKISLKATTGSIRGEIVGNAKDFNIESSTRTGRNNLTNQIVSASDKILKAETSTGSIDVDFIEE